VNKRFSTVYPEPLDVIRHDLDRFLHVKEKKKFDKGFPV